MAKVAPGGYNTYIPNTDATNHMVVEFSRNPQEFRMAEYCQYVPVDKNIGQYIEMNVEEAGRVMDDDGSDHYWADGAQRPSNAGRTEDFEFLLYRTRRREHGFNIGQEAADQAEWQVLAQNSRIQVQQAMTQRTTRAVSVMHTVAGYASGHSETAVTNITGVTGYLDVSTVTRSDIKRTFDFMADTIRQATLGAVKPSQLMVVVGPEWARKIAVCQEIRDYLQQMVKSDTYVTGNLGPHLNYGLPESLYDYKIVVEDAIKVTNKKGGTKATSYVWPGDKIVMCSRIGELVGTEGPSFSSFSTFLKEELSIEEKHDKDNRRHMGSVVDNEVTVHTSPLSSFIVTDTLT